MCLMPQVAAERPTCLTLEAFELAAIAKRLGGRHNADRRGKTLFTELIDLCRRQDFGRGHRDLNETYIRNMLDRQSSDRVAFWCTHVLHTMADSRIGPSQDNRGAGGEVRVR